MLGTGLEKGKQVEVSGARLRYWWHRIPGRLRCILTGPLHGFYVGAKLRPPEKSHLPMLGG